MDNQQKYNQFRERIPEFVYDSFHYDVQPDGLHIAFRFMTSNGVVFEPTAHFPLRPFLHPELLSKHTLDTLVFHIGMIELISYWKAFCPPTVVVKPYKLTETQVAFWKKLYFYGLGEFFYTNGIKATENDFLDIRSEADDYPPLVEESNFVNADTKPDIQNSKIEIQNSEHIVPIGGGKDSVVTLEILSPHVLPLIMNPRGATVECIRKAGYTIDDVIVIKRSIHPKLLEVNEEGALNGHTPFSAMLAFYTLLASALTRNRMRIALSNENSANESTVVGTKVNHQYSKSLEFENDFRQYVAEFISPKFDYYSFLRPLSELQIAMLFARQPKYFDVFKSCNVGSKQDIWCGHCAKCLFAYIILSPFIEPARLNAVFGKNMLDDITLKMEFEQLTGCAETKPFECVGTVGEVHSALAMAIDRWYPDHRPALLQNYKPSVPSTPLHTLSPVNNLPADDFDKLKAVLTQAIKQSNNQALYQLFDGKEILIAGYGREGKSSHALLQQLFPQRQFDIAHNDEEIVAFLKKKRYDLILKSPGIPTSLFEGICELETISSQTDIFLQVYGNSTIGVTGTKGKSTTTSLIYHLLKQTNSDVVLAGNIGIPLFDIIPQLTNQSIVVAELSCHQLENIHRAPHIAVLLNLFQEHLDHYHDYMGYKMAKMQILLKQREGDQFFYCTDNSEAAEMVEMVKSEAVSSIHPYSVKVVNDDEGALLDASPLQGEHNRSNALVAIRVAMAALDTSRIIPEHLSSFVGLRHRLEKIGTFADITWYDDSISTIPAATIAAVRALQRVDTLILGGFDRGIDYSPLVDFITHSDIKNIVFVGAAGRRILQQLTEAIKQSNNQTIKQSHLVEDDYTHIVPWCAANTTAGGVVLLSPAAASYDAFANFEVRGDFFREQILELGN